MNTSNHPHVVAPSREHTHTVIFLHGRDSIAPDFAEELFESQASDGCTLSEIFPTFKWVFPSSKFRNSARFETEMSQWFDMWSVANPEERKELQVDGLKESIALIHGIISSEASLVPIDHIFLGGISQGCATAIHTLMQSRVRLGGFIGLCSWLPFQEEVDGITGSLAQRDISSRWYQGFFMPDSSIAAILDSEQAIVGTESALATPVFLAHARDDEVVPIRNGESLCQSLRHFGMIVTWKAYENGGHWIHEPQGVDDIVIFLQNALHQPKIQASKSMLL